MELPILGKTIKNAAEIREKLVEKIILEHNAYSPPFYHNDAWWTRCSAQVWNEVCFVFVLFLFLFRFLCSFMLMYMPYSKLEDFVKIGKIWLKVCAEVVKELDPDQSQI